MQRAPNARRPSLGATSQHDYDRFSTLAGELAEAPAQGYRVEFKRLGRWRPLRTLLLVAGALLFVAGFLVWLMLPAHWPHGAGLSHLASYVMVVNTGVIGLLAFINVTTLCRASLAARDPVPVRHEPGTRIAFVTTIVPDREPLEMVERTLEAALRIRHDGPLDVWLLDEGRDRAVAAACKRLGVRHFSRRGVKRWNQPAGPHRAKSKHGNYNAWLDAHGRKYQFLISVDPDHVPFECFAERFLGYFRDPDVAFVIGPQVYGNYRGFVARAAESQQFLFHSLLQRAGNRSRTPMLVGTNNAIRLSALKAAGGFHDSITEDMATSLAVHVRRNPKTGRRWSSVYTPDLVAVGEGPETFTDYFTQQYRWSRGTDDVLLTRFWRLAHKLSPRQFVHYSLLMSYYPTTALAWTLGVFNSLLYLTLHTGGLTVPVHLWLMLYVDAAALQVGLYFWNRRHNVSPHERQGSSGLAGMFISTLSTPLYVSSLVSSVLRRKRGFVVTAKGSERSADHLATFRLHLRWAAVIAVPLIVSLAVRGITSPWMYLWTLLTLCVCLAPVVIWRVEARRQASPQARRERQSGERELARERRARRRAEAAATASEGAVEHATLLADGVGSV